MTEPHKHRHARPKRAARPERQSNAGRPQPSRSSGSPRSSGSWFATTPGLVVVVAVVAVVVVGLGFVVRLLLGGEDSSSSGADKRAPGAQNASYGNRWTSPDGYDYEISVATLNDLVSVGSSSSCVAAPRAGASTNLHFTVTIKNRSTKDAPVPTVLFGTNLTPAGGVRTSPPSFAKADKRLEVAPLAKARTCADGARLGPENRAAIPKGGSVTFTGTFGPTALPVASGIVVQVRYFEEDGQRSKPVDLLAPFGSVPEAG